MAGNRPVNSGEEVRDSKKMLASVLTTSWAYPKGIDIQLKHVEGCRNGGYDGDVMETMEKANPRTMTELEMCLRNILLTIGCKKECGVDKEISAGVLFRHSQNSQ